MTIHFPKFYNRIVEGIEVIFPFFGILGRVINYPYPVITG